MQGALSRVEGVKSADVSLEERRAVVTHAKNGVKPAQLIKAVEEAGFRAEEEKKQEGTNLP